MSLIPFEQRIMRRGTKRVLEEDEYVEKLEEVIENQFFPHLKKLKQQLAYIEQNQLFSLHTLRSTYRRIFPAGLDGMSLSSSFPTGAQSITAATDSWETQSIKTFRDQQYSASSSNPQLSVTEFFKRFTSEDNESFEDLHAKSTAEHRRKFHWMHESLGKAILDGTTDYSAPSLNKKAGMLMLYYVGNKILSAEERERMDAILAGEVTVGDNRPNGLDSWAFRVRNQFMFYPELKDSLKVSTVGEANPILPTMIANGQGQKLLTSSSQNKVDESGFVVPGLPRSRQMTVAPSSSTAAIDRRADKIIQTKSAYAPGEAFMQSVDAYLRGGNMSNGPLQGTYSHLIQGPAPLEAPHTPTTIHSSENGSDWESSSVYNDYRSYSKVLNNNTSTVAMSPAPIPGRGLLESPLITWGTIAATPLLLSSQNAADQVSTRTHSHSQLNSISEDHSGQNRQQLVNHDNEIQFQFQPMGERERLAKRLDDKRKQMKSSAAFISDNASHVSALDTPISIRSRRNPLSSSRSNVSSINNTGHSKKRLSDLTPAAQSLARQLQQKLGKLNSAF